MQLLELAKKLISAPSVTPNDAGCQTYLADYLAKLKSQCEPFNFDGVDNLWARLGNSEPLFVFAGHTDVVPPGPEDKWISPPFTPEIRDNFLFGRGTVDMKCALGAMVFAAEEFLNAQPKFKGSIAFLITSDEEGPAINGTKKIIELLKSRNTIIGYC